MERGGRVRGSHEGANLGWAAGSSILINGRRGVNLASKIVPIFLK